MIDINSKLSGRYIITQTVGSGGMANVYLARDLILDRDVAVKVLKFDFQDNQDAIRRFQREAMAASQLLHQNIVEVYDVDEQDGQQYIVMEYVDGTDLKNFIRERSPISLELIVNIMSQIMSGIDAAHRHGIIHRDIKPQNILITHENRVKITDFGIAIALSDTSLTQTNTLLGSVHYLSPEQARGGNATIKSDIYALGVVLYELITGEVPYTGESAVSIALKHFQEDFPLIRDEFDYVPQSMENVVLRATAKNLDLRYNSTQEMLGDLSTSLSVNRMHEKRFNFDQEEEELSVITPIKPISVGDQALSSVESEIEIETQTVQPTYDDIPPISKPRRNYRWIARIITLVLVILTLFALTSFISQSLRKTHIPDVSNLSQEEAIQRLEEAEIQVAEVTNQWHDKVAQGKVIKTDPKANTQIDKNTSINLIVSSGREQVEIGDYLGQEYEHVRQLLIQAGFIVERNDMYTNEPSESGRIMAQSIEAGSRLVPSSTSITFTVGSFSESSVMQDFYNLSISMAESFALNYGLNLEVTEEYNDYIPENQIVGQSPVSGTPLYPGDTISVIVSLGPEESEIVPVVVPVYLEYIPRYAENDYDQEKPLPNEIQVFIGDSNNNINQVVEEFEITESRTIQITLYVPSDGTSQYRVMRDGEVIDESYSVYPEYGLE